MRPLARPFMVLAIRMALVVLVLRIACLAMMLTIAVGLGFNVAAVALAFGALARLAAEDGAAQSNAHNGDHGDGNPLLLADVQFVRVEFHVHSLFAGGVVVGSDAPITRSMSAAARCASASALRYWDWAAK